MIAGGFLRATVSVMLAVLVCLGAGSSEPFAAGTIQQPSSGPESPPEKGPAGLTGSRIYQAWEWSYEQRAYPLGYIPTGAKARALQAQASAARGSLHGPTDPWLSVGPAPILGGQIGSTGNTRPVSGRVSSVAVDPSNPSRWLVGAAQGGIWETTDSGATWRPKTDDQDSLAMGAIAFSPSNPSVIYGGTGEAVFSGDAYAGAGLLKSSDGGTTWQLLAASTFANTTFSDLKVDPTGANLVLAAITYGFAGRGGGPTPPTPPRGILKSTDGGVTWIQTLDGDATALKPRPGDFANQYAGLGNIFGGSANGVYRSTDAGGSWTVVSGPWASPAGRVGRVLLASAPSDPNVMYVSIQDAFRGGGVEGGLLGLWRTNNAWDVTPSWTRISVAATDDGSGLLGYCGWDPAYLSANRQCWYSHEIIVDPVNADVLYAGGGPLWKFDGTTWTEVSKTAADPTHGIHVDQHGMAWAGGRLVVGNDGGVWSTPDGGATWADHNTNLAITQFYYGSQHPTNPNFVLGGSQDNGTERWTGTPAWRWIFGGDGAENAIASAPCALAQPACPDLRWAVSAQSLTIRRTLDGGQSYTVADAGIDKSGVPFIARLKLCPANDDIMIAGTNNLWKSSNFFSGPSPTWAGNSPKFGSISALAFAPSDVTCQTYALGTNQGQLRLTADGGSTWVDLNPGGDVPGRYVTGLAFDQGDANVVYVTLSGFDEGTPGRPGHVFKAADALTGTPTWTDITPPVNLPHNAIGVDPAVPANVYVGTDLGVWQSTDGGSTWTPFGPVLGMPNVAVFDLQVNATGVVAFTHGRGAFTHPP